ncbi:MAG: HIT family protein [Bacteroidales bacterium]|nr:HIT family protein [Bacteroidales bacterium]
MATIFSKIIAGEIPSFKVAESERFYAFLDINPVSAGHTLVVPKNETDYIFDMESEEFSSMFAFAQKVAKGIKEVIPCKRVGVAVLGLEVPHAHIHLIPINSESDMDFRKAKIKLENSKMADIANAIKSKIKL